MATVNYNAPSATPAAAPAKNVDTQSVLKRLQSELMALMMSGETGISAFPEEDNIFCWKGTITGSKDTVFEGTEYKLSLAFPNSYPFKPPKVKFETTCFHPNVDVYGNICLDILQDKWSSAYDVRTILLSIQSLLGGLFCTRYLCNFLLRMLFQQWIRFDRSMSQCCLDLMLLCVCLYAHLVYRAKHQFATQHSGSTNVEQSRRVPEDGGEVVQASSSNCIG
ncbi:unnamed protein product [Linum tenue]|uniref:E2 ubiquitin-conjugating enzyme n=1 Tax=Linum tenue TaxID=586396 RepID=A0AAV0JW28_9ROSI|nr:unnamed protein product [Linum tenue]